jgi:hypothetical protein
MVTRKILKNYLYTHYIYIKVKDEKNEEKNDICVCLHVLHYYLKNEKHI